MNKSANFEAVLELFLEIAIIELYPSCRFVFGRYNIRITENSNDLIEGPLLSFESRDCLPQRRYIFAECLVLFPLAFHKADVFHDLI